MFMLNFKIKSLAAAIGFFAAISSAAAQAVTGQSVYENTCSTCHAAGVAGAPKFGDKKAWAALIAEPQAQLTAHGYVGVRGMPPKGGRADLSLEDFSKAVVHMAKAAGSPWKNPDAKMMSKIKKEILLREAALKAKAK